MRSKRKWIAGLSAVALSAALAVGCLYTGADAGTGDLDGDGKITIHDAQLKLEGNTNEAGNGWTVDELVQRIRNSKDTAPAKNAAGVYQLETAVDLYWMAQHPDYDYVLMNSIDMNGKNWEPFALSGSFDGGSYTISNALITKGKKNSVASTEDQGFFSEILAGASVKNLTLLNIDIVASENAQCIGLLAGTNRGTVTGCYMEGSITDKRETASFDNSVGSNTLLCAAIGRNVGIGKYTPVTKAATEPSQEKGNYSVAAKLALFTDGRADIKPGLVAGANLPANTYQWQDITSSYNVDPEFVERQTTVVETMMDMATVTWSPQDNLSYTAASTAKSSWTKGVNYTGLPYGHMNSSLARFEYAQNNWSTLKSKYTNWVVSDYTAEATGETDYGYSGFVRYMSADCSSAINHAWLSVSPVSVGEGYNYNGVMVGFTNYMIPSDQNVERYGLIRVGNYQLPGNWVHWRDDPNNGHNWSDSLDIWAANTENSYAVMYDAFAQARKGDALICWINDGIANGVQEGHSRLIAENPVVIRNVNGTIDIDKSYFITIEQGGREEARATDTVVNRSTWGVNYKYYFTDLDVEIPSDVQNTNNSSRAYVPISMAKLRTDTAVTKLVLNDDLQKNGVYTDRVTDAGIGKLWSNYRIEKVVMSLTDSSGKTTEYTAWNGVGDGNRQSAGAARDQNSFGQIFVMSENFGDVYANLTDGEYTMTLKVTLNGIAGEQQFIFADDTTSVTFYKET